MKFLGALFLACLLSGGAAAYQGIMPDSETTTVQAGPLTVNLGDVLMKEKPEGAYLLWDAFPYRQSLKGKGEKALRDVVQGLVDGPLLARFPKASKVKADVVEYSERDNCGAPVWDKVTVLSRFEGKVVKKKARLKQTKGRTVVH
jgi:hypothetical protein